MSTRGMPSSETYRTGDLTPDLLELRFIIDWLMSVGVSSPRLAGLFKTSPENIRRLKYFAARQLEPSLITFVPDLEMCLLRPCMAASAFAHTEKSCAGRKNQVRHSPGWRSKSRRDLNPTDSNTGFSTEPEACFSLSKNSDTYQRRAASL